MTRTYTRLHGHKWGLPGIQYRAGDNKPFYVKFERNYRNILVGRYLTLREATAAAKAFLDNEKATPLCPPPSPATATPTVKPSSTQP